MGHREKLGFSCMNIHAQNDLSLILYSGPDDMMTHCDEKQHHRVPMKI